MNQAWTTRVSRRQWLACIAILATALVGELAMAPRARAADLSPYYYQGSGCCGCPCGCGCGVHYPPPPPVIERHVIDHDVYERRYGGYPYPVNDLFPYGYGGVRSHAPYAAYGYYDVPRPPAPVGYPTGYYEGY